MTARKIRISLCALIIVVSSQTSYTQVQNSFWEKINGDIKLSLEKRSTIPEKFIAYSLDLNAMKHALSTAISEDSPNAFSNAPIISLPLPDGSFSRFSVALSPVIPERMAAAYPMIRAFSAKGIDDPYAVAKIDYTVWGFHAMIMSPNGWVFIDPASMGNSYEYICYARSDSRPAQTFVCDAADFAFEYRAYIANDVLRTSGGTLKTYRLALACTGEYAGFYGGTVSGALSGMVTSVNRVNGVYEIENAIRLVLIPNTDQLIYLNSATDPYTNGSGSTMLGQNQTTINSVIGSANYDIGHVFSTGGGGVAYLQSVCASNKAGGVTGSSAPINDAFDIDYVAHEMGHQFGGNHTFNSVTGSCNGNRSSTAAYEPGSGTTIMAYAGICGADNIQPHSDPIFHTKSYDEIQIFITTGGGNSCDVATGTGNNPPVVTNPSNYTIPVSTPFALTGSATDADLDPLTYLWEEFDLGPSGSPNNPSGNAPIFRDFTPVTTPTRIFPRIEDLVRNQQTLGEILPSYGRSLVFRLTARDNRIGGGGVGYNNTAVTLTVAGTSTPFKVTSPNTGLNWFANSTQTITWDVSSTNLSPINCATVNILLSIDSGYTFPYTLVANTPNDGSQSITLPNVISNKARIKVEAVGNIFFDFSDVNFIISSSSSVLSIITTTSPSSATLCAGDNVSVSYSTDGPANSGNVFTAQLSNSSGSFASPVNIGTLNSTTSGTINAQIPSGISSGNGYRIRIVSSNPAVTGSDNGVNISISRPVGNPGSVNGPAIVCQGTTGNIYSVSSIANATGYLWSLPAGATITSGNNTNAITVSFSGSASSGPVTVRGTNSGCGDGPLSAPFVIAVNTLPGDAGPISGANVICQGSAGISYSIIPIAGVTGYDWSLPAGATITSGSNTNSITVDFSVSALGGNITVAGINACGAGIASTLPVYTATVPAPASVNANGPASFCTGDSVKLSYAQLPNVAYTWRKDGTSLPGQTGNTYTATSTGIYDVIGASAQTFANNEIVSIPDYTTGSCLYGSSVIHVSGYAGTIPSIGISIKLNITHTYDGDLVILLQSPDGSILGLSNQRGGSANNFTNTVFTDAAAAVLPASGAPYTGSYKPVASVFSVSSCVTTTVTSFNSIGGGSVNPNGNWILRVYDRASVDIGTIDNWSISFPASIEGPCFNVSNNIVVTDNPPVPVSVSILSNSGMEICAGNAVTFNATTVNGGASPSFQWKVNGLNAGSNNAQFISSSLSNGDDISCVMTSNADCVTGNPATSNTITMSVSAGPSITSFSPVSGTAGTLVTLLGSGFSGTTDVQFNGASAGFVVYNDGLLTTNAPAGGSSGFITITTGCGLAPTVLPFTYNATVTVSIRILIEGYYKSGGQMKGVLSATECDTVQLGLAESISPNSIVQSQKQVLDLSGNATFTFSGGIFGNAYYLVVMHRNSLQTWSHDPISFNAGTINYDFTTAANKAFGNNLKNVDGYFVVHSGDVNQDGNIDAIDIDLVEKSATLFINGYLAEDLNGDSICGSSDFSIVENNFSISLLRP